ncbi:MAG: TIR domain-containing protein, partial [Planctomycetota bacterium]
MTPARHRPAVFIGSSCEGHKLAREIQVQLDRACEVDIGDQGVFGLSQGTLESLVLALGRFDFAVLVLTADDLTIKRG